MKIADIKPTKITKLLISHWHGDHVLGLPGLLQTMNASGYEKKLDIYGPSGTKKFFEHLFSAFSFRIGFEHTINEIGDSEIDLKELTIVSKELDHSMPCVGYSVTEKDKRRIKVSYVKSLGIPDGPLLGELQDNKKVVWKGKTVLPEDSTFIVRGKKVAFVLDTVPCNGALGLATESDLLVCEATYSSEQLDKAEGNKHMTAKDAAALAAQSNSKKLVLTHFSQRYKTTEEVLCEAKDIFENTFASFDFMKVKI
jgi:ribonuclease Z